MDLCLLLDSAPRECKEKQLWGFLLLVLSLFESLHSAILHQGQNSRQILTSKVVMDMAPWARQVCLLGAGSGARQLGVWTEACTNGWMWEQEH